MGRKKEQGPRVNGFEFRTTDEERRMLDELAERDGLARADVLRVLVRRAHREAFGASAKGKR